VFEQLSDRLTATFEKLQGRARVSDADLDEALRDVRVALLEADVNFKIVRELVATVRERAIGQKVLESVTGAQMVVKIVHDALVAMLGGEAVPLATATAWEVSWRFANPCSSSTVRGPRVIEPVANASETILATSSRSSALKTGRAGGTRVNFVVQIVRSTIGEAASRSGGRRAACRRGIRTRIQG